MKTHPAFFAAALLSIATIGAVKAQDYTAIVAAPDRSDADRQTDKRRQPEKMMAFTAPIVAMLKNAAAKNAASVFI